METALKKNFLGARKGANVVVIDKKIKNVFAVLCFSLVFSAVFAFPCAATWEMDKKTAELIEARQSDIWAEGAMLGDDIVIGSRGLLKIIYVDAALSKAIGNDVHLQNWVYAMAQYYGTKETAGKKLFIAYVKTNKPWNFDYAKISIGGYSLTKDDVLSPSMTNPFGNLDSDVEGYFAFAVPASAVKANKETEIRYGDDVVKWKALK